MSQTFTDEELAAERWLPVVDCDWLEVSDLGRVRRLSGGAIVHQSDKGGYRTVKIRGANRSVHQLVLESFVGPCPEGHLTRHFPDPTKSNNRLANLAWGTYAQNSADRGLHGQGACGDRHHLSRLTSAGVALARWLSIDHGATNIDLAEWLDVSAGAISLAVNNRSWKHVPPYRPLTQAAE